MTKALVMLTAVLASMSMAARGQQRGASSAQLPTSGQVTLQNPLSAAQTRVLAERFKARPANQTLNIDPNKVRAVAGPQTKPVIVQPSPSSASSVAASLRAVNLSAPPPQTSPAEVEFVQTSNSEEALLRRAVASQDALKPALHSIDSGLVTLPGVVRMKVPDGQLQLKPFVLVDQALRRDASGAFTAELLVGVTELTQSNVIRQLPTPLLFQIAGADRTEPESILLPTTSPPFTKVQVWIDSVQGSSAELKFMSLLNREGMPISIPVRGDLTVEPVTSTIDGFGLQATKLNISVEGVSNPAGLEVMLHADSGYLDPSTVKLGPDGTASATLRSDVMGKTTVTARSPGLSTASSPVWFRMPYLTILASLLGGIAGGFVSFARYPDRRAQWRFSLGVAAVFGLIGFALYAVGINILPIAPTVSVGLALAFAFSAVCGFVGPGVISWAPK